MPFVFNVFTGNFDAVTTGGGVGPPGPAGPAGAAGAPGATGTDGEDAPWMPPVPGLDGLPGPQGWPGPAGADGDDAPPWSIPGADGGPGATGIPGPAGLDGEEGTPLVLLVPAPVTQVVQEALTAASYPNAAGVALNNVAITPRAGTDAVYWRGTRCRRVASAPGLNEYTISGRAITLGFIVQQTDHLFVDYSY